MQRFKSIISSPQQPAHSEDSRFALELRHLEVKFNGQKALQDLSFKVESGMRVAVVGPNGAGKSTLFNVLAGVLPASVGNVLVHGHDPAQHVCIAYVTQSHQVDWGFPITVREVVMMGRAGLLGLFRRPTSLDWQRVGESLALVKMEHHAERQIGELSGGQKQRMFIARALAQEADVMLMDEALAGLDLHSQEHVFAVLDDLKTQDVTVLFATHDLNLAGAQFDRLILLNRRLVAYGPPNEVLTAENLSRAYGGLVQMVETNQGTVMVGDMGGHHEHSEEGPHG
jgi:ABC-type Mn2+/Zn2+ transport system ATPase subunit